MVLIGEIKPVTVNLIHTAQHFEPSTIFSPDETICTDVDLGSIVWQLICVSLCLQASRWQEGSQDII
jgi:hypothetical protein